MKYKTRTPDILIALGIFSIGALYYYTFRRFGWFMQDEGVLYYPFLRTMQGQLPYRDFFTGYPPLVYYIHALIFRHIEISIPVIRTLMGVINATTAAILFLIARRIAPRSFALLAGLLFLVMQPGEMTGMDYHNSPYPSWYAIFFFALATWAALRALEASTPSNRGLCFFIAGILAGFTLLSKQNAGIFLLWGLSGFLVSFPLARNGGSGQVRTEQLWLHFARLGYLALIPIAATILISSYLTPITLLFFVAPLVALASIGARGRFSPAEGRQMIGYAVLIGAGFALAFAPWLVFFGEQIGYANFLRALLLMGDNVIQNLFVPLKPPDVLTFILLGPVALAVALGLGRRMLFSPSKAGATEPHTNRPLLWFALVAPVILLAGTLIAGSEFIDNFLNMQYGLGQIYLAVTQSLDRVATYGSVLLLGAAIAVAYRQASGAPRDDDPPRAAFFLILWCAACAYLLYFPRMDSAHLYVGGAPMLYLLGVALLPRARSRILESLPSLDRRGVRFIFNIACVGFFAFVITSRTMPKIYSLVNIKPAPGGGGLEIRPTDIERLDMPRVGLYFPIYLEEQRKRIVDFRNLVSYVQSHTSASDPLFTYPALSMLYFVSGRDNPTRHDYFFGNNVGFRDQIEIVRTLEDQKVPYVVITSSPTDYFTAKGKDFTRLITDYLKSRYYLDKRIGPYDVLRRFGTKEERANAPVEEPLP